MVRIEKHRKGYLSIYLYLHYVFVCVVCDHVFIIVRCFRILFTIEISFGFKLARAIELCSSLGLAAAANASYFFLHKETVSTDRPCEQ